MKWLGIAGVTAALLVAPGVAEAGGKPRPSDAAPGSTATNFVPNELQVYNDYAAPERTFASKRAVVHYVVLGVDAPPLNDDDRGGVPDYVERVGEAADTAIACFERRRFAAILADTGGPDARPDVYVSRFAAGYFGVAFPAVEARDGAFVVVSNALDPSPERSLGSLYGTIAHELFHLVQFSYFSRNEEPALPGWVLEGSAAAMEGRVYPELSDIVTSLQLRRWFSAPQRGLTGQTYGSQLFWRYLDEREPRVLPAYLGRLASRPPRSAAAALAASYERVASRSFAAAFADFATWVAGEYSAEITPVRPSGRPNAPVAALGIQFVRLPRSTRSVKVRVSGRTTRVALVYELASETAGEAAVTRRLHGRTVEGALVYVVPETLRRSARFTLPTLVIANGAPSQVAGYSLAVT